VKALLVSRSLYRDARNAKREAELESGAEWWQLQGKRK
jgi:hypothetical protein